MDEAPRFVVRLVKERVKTSRRGKSVRVDRWYAYFFQSPLLEEAPKERGRLDLRARVEPRELRKLARELGCQIDDLTIYPPSWDAYNSLTVYAAVRATLRSPSNIMQLLEVVRGLSSYDAQYWAGRLREEYWRTRKFNPLYRVAKAFKILYGVGE